MRGWLFGLILIVTAPACLGQPDSMWVMPDTVLKGKFRMQSFGASFRNGTNQYFDGYNYVALLANSRAGLPLFFDWPEYSGQVLNPEYLQFEGHVAWVDTVRGFKMRGGLTYFQRFDTMATTSFVARFDTILGRNASEFTRFGGVTWAGMKQSRKLGNFLRLYGGAEVELMFSPRSDINFVEYAYDSGDQEFLSINEFEVIGKPKFAGYASAILGLETVFFHRIGLLLEVKSGLGMQLIVNEGTFGLAKNAYHLGLNYYLFDYKRKPLPGPILVPIEEKVFPEPQGIE